MTQHPGWLLVLLGTALLLGGLLWVYAPGVFSWMGRLPGDVRIEGDGTRVYVPITTCIVLSLLLSALLWLARWLNR